MAHSTRRIGKRENGAYEIALHDCGLLEEDAFSGVRNLDKAGSVKTEFRSPALRVRGTKKALETL